MFTQKLILSIIYYIELMVLMIFIYLDGPFTKCCDFLHIEFGVPGGIDLFARKEHDHSVYKASF